MLDDATRRSSIRQILFLILAAALVPLLLLSGWQAATELRRDHETQRSKLEQAARLVAEREHYGFELARGVLAVLAANPDVRSLAQAKCVPPLATAQQAFPAFRHIRRLDAKGRAVCASDPAILGQQPDTLEDWERVNLSLIHI